MATVAESLFGVTPESLQRRRQQQLRQEAMDFASISDPFQQANFAIYQGTGNLARGVGGMLGAQDPELMRVRQRQELLQGVNPADPASLREAAQRAMAANDFQAAQLFSDRALSAERTQAQINADVALTNQRNRERASADPFQQFLRSAVGKVTPESLSAYQQSGNPSDLVWTEKANQTEIERLQAYRNSLPAGSRERLEVDAVIKGAAEGRGTKVTVNPEIKMAPDIVGAVNAVDKATEKEVNMLDSARLAKQLINQTANSNNSQTWEAARTTIAKAVGENKLSNEDIRRTGVDPRLVQGALDWVNKKISGVPNQDIQQQLFMLGSVLENSAAARYDAKVSRYRGAAQASGFPGQPSTYFPTAAERNQPAPQSNVRDWNSLNR